MEQLVEITLSHDRFESEILAEAIIAEGHEIHVVHDDSSGSVGAPPHPSRLLVHAAEVDDVRAIINRSFALDSSTHEEQQSTSTRARIAGLALFSVMFLLPLLAILLNWAFG